MGREIVGPFHRLAGRTAQLAEIHFRDRLELLLSLRRQPQVNAPGVSGIGSTPDQPKLLDAAYQLHGRVMPDQQETRHVGDGGGTRTNKPFDAEERLMLLRGQPLPLRGHFAERQKYTELIAEFRQRLVVDRGRSFAGLSLSVIWPRGRSSWPLRSRHPPFPPCSMGRIRRTDGKTYQARHRPATPFRDDNSSSGGLSIGGGDSRVSSRKSTLLRLHGKGG